MTGLPAVGANVPDDVWIDDPFFRTSEYPYAPAHVGKLISRTLPAGWTTHTLRHRFASQAYAVDRDIRAVQELLGHASVVTTQIYTAIPDNARRRAAAGADLPLVA